ncbi:MAG: LpqB family beta-propeller domain-containing protein [Candidatus Poribacteria bacterium]|nr:LpqB family beta-propeller domain-containing protein [Candidatus Poribacteria bacterium]
MFSKVFRGTVALSIAMAFVVFVAGCDSSIIPTGDDVGNRYQFGTPLPKWMTFSRDGTKLVYERANVLVLVTDPELRDPVAMTGNDPYEHPSFSPDGAWVVYDYRPERFRQSDLWARPVDYSAVPRRITDSYARDFMPQWSGDGKWVSFHSTRNPVNNIWVVPAAGGEPLALGTAQATERSHAWSPDGARLAFERLTGNNTDIWVGDPTTGQVELLVESPASDKQPVWRPDGEAIGFLSFVNGKWNISVREFDEAEPRRITSVSSNIASFGWLMGGRAVIYQTVDKALYAQMDEEGASPVKLRDVTDFTVSPDGMRYVYIGATDDQNRVLVDPIPTEFLP